MPHPDLTIATGRTESPRFMPPRSGRSLSVSSDRTSTIGYNGLISPPTNITPAPSFIAASAASQIVTNDHDSQADAWLDQHGIQPSGETALVAPPALRLVNSFLDQLLFNFLSAARATSLRQLRPAVLEILKPKLANAAIRGAEQELQEYLGEDQDDDLLAFGSRPESRQDWDLELAWKRTRLRCMVYSSLGDMEEDDEDFYTEQEHLGSNPQDGGATDSLVVSPAVAIFLTAILEFMGEQLLLVAGQAAYHRLRARHLRDDQDDALGDGDIADRVIVEDMDVEKAALDRTLGRLWRGWKKRVRSPPGSISLRQSFSPETQAQGPIPSLATVLQDYEQAAAIPLPESEDDVREIEIPGLTMHQEDQRTWHAGEGLDGRPRSLLIFRFPMQGPPTPAPSLPGSPIVQSGKTRPRSHSLPSPTTTLFSVFSQPYRDAALRDQSAVEEDDDVHAPTTEAAEDADHDTRQIGQDTNVCGSQTPKDTIADDSELSESEAEIIEEPRIMTSSRISYGGRVSPEDSSRPASIRASSIHSLRLVDTLRSPTNRVAMDEVIPRVINISRSNSITSPIAPQTPLMVSPITRMDSPRKQGSPIKHVNRGSPPKSASPPKQGSPRRHDTAGRGMLQNRTNSAYEDGVSSVSAVSLASEKSGYHTPESLSAEVATPANAPRMSVIPADLALAMQGVDLDPSPTSQHYIPMPLDKDAMEPPVMFSAPPPRHPMRPELRIQPGRSIDLTNNVPLSPLTESAEVSSTTSPKASRASPSHTSPATSSTTRGRDSPKQESKAKETKKARILHEDSSPERSLDRAPASLPRHSPPRRKQNESVKNHSGDPNAKIQRPSHAATSSTSSNKLKPVRTSEDSIAARPDRVGHTFEDLMRSDHTVQYTLTPQNVRTAGTPDSAQFPPIAPISVPDGSGSGHSRTRGVSGSKFIPSHSSSLVTSSKAVAPAKAFQAPVPPVKTQSTRLRTNVPQARDPRVDRDSVVDFADFIRSTGPARTSDAPRSASATLPSTSKTGDLRTGSVSSRMSSGMPKRADTVARPRLQARDAVVSNDSITDLIDFVRSGPKLSDNHRIPRTVAPFRTTMDSDQLNAASGGAAIDASLPDGRYSQLSTNPSLQSMTSQTALLSSKGNTNKPMPTRVAPDDDAMPKRKTRRIRDPYAIDTSDEEDADEPEEESLADFLRNAIPPEETSLDSTLPSSKPKKKPSFFGRNSVVPPLPPPKSAAQAKSASPKTTSQPHGSASAPQQHGIASNNYMSQVDSARNPTTSSQNAKVAKSAPVNASQGHAPRVLQKHYQPREASSTKTGTSDLADFLRNSEPPASFTPPKALALGLGAAGEERDRDLRGSSGGGGGLTSRMFGRRKKMAAGY